jgi:hypothetical protein
MPKFFQQVPEESIGPQAAKQAAAADIFLEAKKAMPASMQMGRRAEFAQLAQDSGIGAG